MQAARILIPAMGEAPKATACLSENTDGLVTVTVDMADGEKLMANLQLQ